MAEGIGKRFPTFEQVKTQLDKKQGSISDIETIRDGASKGATALQEHQQMKTINGQSIVGSGNITIEGGGGGGTIDIQQDFVIGETIFLGTASYDEDTDTITLGSEASYDETTDTITINE